MARSGFYGPKVALRYARPTFRWEVWSDRGGVVSTEMKVNGKPVPAVYDAARRSIQFTPEAALKPGTQNVHCRITFRGDYSFQRDWNASVPTGALTRLPPVSDGQRSALQAANSLRSVLRLPPFVFDTRMAAAAQAHAEYLALNRTTGHLESPDAAGFVGSAPSARLESFGWGGSSWEDLTYSTESPERSIRMLFDAPYHRIPFLQPGSPAFGFGISGEKAAVEFEGVSQKAIVVSPSAGQVDVPCAWEQLESPSPLRVHAGVSGPTGYPIVLASFAANRRVLQINSARLSQSDEEVPCLLNTPENDDHLNNAAILLPLRPLRPGVEYQVAIAGTGLDGRSFRVEWSFRTENR